MWCYEIWNAKTGEELMIFGYSLRDAFRREGLDFNDDNWRVFTQVYED